MDRNRGAVLMVAGAACLLIAAAVFLLSRDASIDLPEPGGSSGTASGGREMPERTLAARSGTPFLPVTSGADRRPEIEQIEIPSFAGAAAVWGATGRDDRGHLWFGVTAEGVPNPSAHLFELPPDSQVAIDRGSVITELRRNGLFRHDEGQMKIHSKILQADDGALYFASMDEQGEADDGSRLPTWGSHLWRLHLQDHRWEHLMSVPEGLIAIAGFGRHLYALGLFGHVVYRFDIDTGESHSVRVGSVKGHVTRNFFCDASGHVYVPKLVSQSPEPAGTDKEPSDFEGLAASLVELDQHLQTVAETPIEHYVNRDFFSDHGLIAFVPLRDGSIVFSTSHGFLYRVIPRDGAAATLESLGWFHPDGAAYTPALFTFDGERFLGGIRSGSARYEWIALDLQTGVRTVHDLTPELKAAGLNKLALYGSVTRDDFGRLLLGGRVAEERHMRPVVLRLTVPTE